MHHRILCPWCNHELPVELGKRAMKEHLIKCILIAQGHKFHDEDQIDLIREQAPEVSRDE